MKKKAIIVSGYFNPIHKGHIAYFNNAKSLCDVLFVIVNSDSAKRFERGLKNFKRKQNGYLLCRISRPLTAAIISIDEDRTVCEIDTFSVRKVINETYDFGFANGGDQNNNSIPEVPVCQGIGN